MRLLWIILVTCFTAFWSHWTFAFNSLVLRDIRKEWEAFSYIETPARILTSTVQRSRSGSYEPNIEYEFKVGESVVRARQIRRSSEKSSPDYSMVKNFPAGSEVRAYYNPGNPADAVLQRGLSGENLFDLMMRVPLNAVMLGLWWFVGGRLFSVSARAPAGGVRIWSRGAETRIRLATSKPLSDLLASLTLASFFVAALVGSTNGPSPPLQVIGTAWAVVLGYSGFVFTRTWRRVHSGREDLVIDDEQQTLRLPATLARAENSVVRLKELRSVSVEWVRRWDRHGWPHHRYAATLRFKDSRREERLVEWREAERAVVFVEWLSSRIRLPANTKAGSEPEA